LVYDQTPLDSRLRGNDNDEKICCKARCRPRGFRRGPSVVGLRSNAAGFPPAREWQWRENML